MYKSYTILVMIAILPVVIVAENHFLNSTSKINNQITEQNASVWGTADSVLNQTTNDSLVYYLEKINLEFNSITAITYDDNGRVWLGSKNGLWVFSGSSFQEYTYKDGLFDKNILGLFCSSEGQIWVATPSGPYALLKNHFYVFEPLKNIKIRAISEDAKNFLFLTEDGIRIFGKEQRIFESIYVKIIFILVLLAGMSLLILWGLKKFKTNVEWKSNIFRVEQEALLAQMNPHFIFNSLNSLQKYILANDQESARSYLQKFARLMRKVLENSSQSFITLSEEIETLDLYLELESLRFDNGFDYEINVEDDEILHIEIPTMLLHPFVENAVWHGLMNKENRGKINLRFAEINKKFILCEIEDNGIGRKRAAELKSKDRVKYKSKGTEIVRKRIELMNLKSRRKITWSTIDLDESKSKQTGTIVRLEIPIH